MKKKYINPTIEVVKIEMQSALMDMSRSEKEISSENAGLVKGDNSSSSSSRYNVWDDDWSAE